MSDKRIIMERPARDGLASIWCQTRSGKHQWQITERDVVEVGPEALGGANAKYPRCTVSMIDADRGVLLKHQNRNELQDLEEGETVTLKFDATPPEVIDRAHFIFRGKTETGRLVFWPAGADDIEDRSPRA